MCEMKRKKFIIQKWFFYRSLGEKVIKHFEWNEGKTENRATADSSKPKRLCKWSVVLLEHNVIGDRFEYMSWHNKIKTLRQIVHCNIGTYSIRSACIANRHETICSTFNSFYTYIVAWSQFVVELAFIYFFSPSFGRVSYGIACINMPNKCATAIRQLWFARTINLLVLLVAVRTCARADASNMPRHFTEAHGFDIHSLVCVCVFLFALNLWASLCVHAFIRRGVLAIH